jgi:hypothetical protein
MEPKFKIIDEALPSNIRISKSDPGITYMFWPKTKINTLKNKIILRQERFSKIRNKLGVHNVTEEIITKLMIVSLYVLPLKCEIRYFMK